MAKQIEMEKVTVEIPKAVMDFLRVMEKDINTYLRDTIVSAFRADIECDGMWGYEEFEERFNLKPIFERF